MSNDTLKGFNRRTFLRTFGGAIVAGTLADRLLAGQGMLNSPSAWTPVRVNGVVRVGGTGVGRVAVSDGRTVAVTAPDGTFSLITDARRQHVFVSLPSSAEIPLSLRSR
jgi:hypothetical protein